MNSKETTLIIVSIVILCSVYLMAVIHNSAILEEMKTSEISKTHKISLNKTEIQNTERLELLNEQCNYILRKSAGYHQPSIFSGLVYVKDGFHEKQENKKDVVLCAPAKTGTSSWRVGIMSMYHLNFTLQDSENGKTKPKSNFAVLPRVRDLSTKKTHNLTDQFSRDLETSERVPNLLKILHVRHPFRRIYSAWSDKFCDFERSLAYVKIVKNRVLSKSDLKKRKVYQKIVDDSMFFYENEASLKLKSISRTDGITINYMVSFQAFLKWIISGTAFKKSFTGWEKSEHWVPMNQFCNVCNVKYDIISKLETIELDIELVLDRLGAVGNFSLPRLNRKNLDEYEDGAVEKQPGKLDFDSSLIADFQRAGIDEFLLDSLYRVYEMDFTFFGYDYQSFRLKYNSVLNVNK